ncbi:MAG: carbamate kinase [Candidatus Aenigmatarchaeota archaeon]|nr:carbamate kinase [Candidatus Aenigmarchaeota archaeon]
MKLAVVALGGNALIHPKERGTAERQIKHVNETILRLKSLVKKFSLVLTNGNGPQIGNLLLQQEHYKQTIPVMPLDTLDAMTQGQLGYWIQQSVENILKKNAVTIITRVLVDKKDPAFKTPTKPIGPYYKKKIFPKMIKEPEGWRRVVPSPKPVKIIDIEEIRSLVKRNFVVIACGGGGIPVIKEKNKFVGVEAVIDKDYSTAKLATQLKAKVLIFLTDVPHVYLNYGQKDQKPILKLKKKDARILLDSGEFKEGSMKPKIEASINFLEKGGKRVIITSPQEINYALAGRGGTVIE